MKGERRAKRVAHPPIGDSVSGSEGEKGRKNDKEGLGRPGASFLHFKPSV